MAARRNNNINNQAKLNSRLVYLWCDDNKTSIKGLAALMGAHPDNLAANLRLQRIPRADAFKRLQEATGLTESDLLMPLVGVV